jgi:hypothetical protein
MQVAVSRLMEQGVVSQQQIGKHDSDRENAIPGFDARAQPKQKHGSQENTRDKATVQTIGDGHVPRAGTLKPKHRGRHFNGNGHKSVAPSLAWRDELM